MSSPVRTATDTPRRKATMMEDLKTIRVLWREIPTFEFLLIPEGNELEQAVVEMREGQRKTLEQGQATVEFALTLLFIVGFSFFFIQLSLVLAWANYIHYATFMSARAYLSSGFSPQDQEERARRVIVRMLKQGQIRQNIDRLPNVARGIGGDGPSGFFVKPPSQFNSKTRNFSWLEGVRYAFKSKLFLIPFAGSSGGKGGGGGIEKKSVNEISLTSESWLGREPSFDECMAFLSNKVKSAGVSKVVIDNGC